MNETLQRLEREGLKVASFPKRILAFVIDKAIISLIVLIVFYDSLINTTDIIEISEALQNSFLALFLLDFSYQLIFTFLYGASIGKIVCKIAIVDEKLLDKPNFMQSALRSLMRYISENAFYLGFAWAFGNDLRKSWQDYIAKTLVIEIA